MIDDEINCGMIGCGSVTEVKSGPAFSKVAHSRLIAVMRRDAVKAADYARRHGVSRWYSDASRLIGDKDNNAVYVATLPDTHALYAIQAMRAGKPVYVEKPMTRNYAECLEMIRVSQETGKPLFVAYYRRTLPAFLKVKELIGTGSIGTPLTVSIRLYKTAEEKDLPAEQHSWHVNPKIGGAGHFFDLASHQFDYLDFLFGPVTKVHGIAQNRAGYYRAEDTVSAVFNFARGVVGSGSWCFVADDNSVEDIIEITGTEGKITFPCFAGSNVVLINASGESVFSFRNPEHISQNLVEQVVNTLRGKGQCVSTMYTAARTSKVLDEIVKGYYQSL
jgi:predicted dehydrogenase